MTAISQIAAMEEWERSIFVGQRIRTTERLLATLRHRGQRRLAADSAFSEQRLLRFANAADLMRITGIGPQSVELLRAAGVNTVRELRQRNAGRLHAAILEANAQLKIAEFPPALNFVRRWIAQAKRLELMITY